MSKVSPVLASFFCTWIAASLTGCGTHAAKTQAVPTVTALDKKITGEAPAEAPKVKIGIKAIYLYQFHSRYDNVYPVAVEVLHDDADIDSDINPYPYSVAGFSIVNGPYFAGPTFEPPTRDRIVFYAQSADQKPTDIVLEDVVLRTKAGGVMTLDHFDGIKSNVDLTAPVHYDTLPVYPHPSI